MCLKYGRFSAWRAYKLRALKKKCVVVEYSKFQVRRRPKMPFLHYLLALTANSRISFTPMFNLTAKKLDQGLNDQPGSPISIKIRFLPDLFLAFSQPLSLFLSVEVISLSVRVFVITCIFMTVSESA